MNSGVSRCRRGFPKWASECAHWLCALLLLWPACGLADKGEQALVSVEDLNKKIKPVYLSDTNGRYQLLERMQADYCQRLDSLPCKSTSGRCASLVLEKLTKRFGVQPHKVEEAAVQSLFDFCALHGTKFEPTGSHHMLSQSLGRVHATAKLMSVALESAPIVGSLPLRELNASAVHFAIPIIYVNQRFATVTADFSKIACLSIPVRKTDKGVEVLADERASQALIEQTPDIRAAMLYFLGVYMGEPDNREYGSSALCDDVTLAYTTAVQDFVVAHEYAHLWLRHPSTLSTDLLYAPQPTSDLRSSTAGLSSPFTRELEADAFAFRIMARSIGKFSAVDETGFHQNYLGGIEFYFQIRDVFQEAASTQSPASGSTVDSTSAELAGRIAACINEPRCSVTQFVGELAKTFDLSTHPPARFRRSVAEQYRRLVTNDKPHALAPLVDLLTRNVWLLWVGTRPEWDARAADKAKFAVVGQERKEWAGGYAATIERLLRARRDLASLAEKHPTVLTYQQGLNAVAGDLGDLAMAQKNYPAAELEYAVALGGAKKMITASRTQPQSEEHSNGRRQMIQALKRLGELAAKAGDRAKSADMYAEAIQVAEGLLKDLPQVLPVREDLAEAIIQFANLRLGLNDLGSAAISLQRLGPVLDDAPSRSEVIDEMQSIRSELLWKLGDARRALHDGPSAVAHYVLAIALLDRLAASLPTHAEYQRVLAQRSTLLAFLAPDLQSWTTVLDKWRELERRGGVREADRVVIEAVARRAAAGR